MDIQSARQVLCDKGVEVVHVGQFDYAGILRERRLSRDSFLAWLRTPRFPNTISKWDCADQLYAGGPHMTERVSVDWDSLRNWSFEDKAALVIAEFAEDCSGLMPRQVLARQIARAESMGFAVRAAFEFEFILLQETAESLRSGGYTPLRRHAPDNKCWSGQTAADQAQLIAALERDVRANDIAVFGIAGELGPGCFEGTLAAVPGLRAADDAALFRQVTRAYARRHNMTASFMALMGADFPGLGGHINLSLSDAKTGANLFADPQGKTNDLARQFIGGMAAMVPEAFALCAHTVNAYRRFAPGSWAPKSLTWAEWTFTTAVRSAPSPHDDARLEFRLPGADCNPHLALALMIAAGLDGIERQLVPPDPAGALGPDDLQPGAARFPGSLGEAATRLLGSSAASRTFGDHFVAHFAKACQVEHASLARAVSAAELARYIEG